MPFIAFALLLSSVIAQGTPGEIYSACTTVGNPLDPNGDGFISTANTGFPIVLNDESDDFEGAGWNVVWHLDGEPTNDTETGGACNATEIVDNPNTNQHAAYFRLVDPDSDPTNRNEQFIIRMRIAKNPQGAYGYSMLIDTDLLFGSTGTDADPNATSGNPGFELEIIYGSGNQGGVGLYDIDGTTSGTALVEYNSGERDQRSYAKYSNCGGDPVFIDFYVDMSSFPAGINATTPLRLVFASSSSPSSALGGSASDIGGVDDGTYPDDDLAFTTLVENTPLSSFETGALPTNECNDPAACNYDAAATTDTNCIYPTTWYADTDGDGAGDPLTSQSACDQPAGYVNVAGDQCPSDGNKTAPGLCGCGSVDTDVDSDGVCDDNDLCTDLTACNYADGSNSACTYAATWYADSDSDGVGDTNDSVQACSQPAGYVAGPGDQCPTDASKLLPGDCGCGTADTDSDSDGVSDCNDNCTDTSACNYSDAGNGACTFATTWYADSDSDGFGDPNTSQSACSQPAGYVANSTDNCDGDAAKTDPGTCGCGNVDVDIDSDGVCDTSDNCTDTSACNYSDAGNGACTFATTWYVDSDSDGFGDPNTSQSACSQPAGYVANSTDNCDGDAAKTDPGTCGCGNVDVDIDSDGVCDTSDNCTNASACNYSDAGNGACTFATTWYADSDSDGYGDPNTSQSACSQPAGYVANSTDNCDGDAAKTDPGTCGCGTADADVDGDSVADCNDNCTDVAANNYNDAGNAACTYDSPPSSSSVTADLVTACNGDSVEIELDALHTFGTGATYGISENVTGFASASLNGSTLELDFSGTGLGADTVVISVVTSGTNFLRVPVAEYAYPVRTSAIQVDASSSPSAMDGAMFIDFDNTYGSAITIHLLPAGTLLMSNGVVSVPSASYQIAGFSNVKGCYNPEPATNDTPGAASPARVMVPCVRCSN